MKNTFKSSCKMTSFYARPNFLSAKALSIFLLSTLLMVGCAEDQKRKDKKEGEKKEKTEKKASNLFEIEGKIFSIPSPIQTAFLLKEVGTTYQSNLLNETSRASSYITTQSRALNLGIYGADLGYATIYDQSQEAISYMAVSKRLTNELGISGLYDEKQLKRFESNIGNQDSLLALVSDAFKSADQYLKNNQQSDLSVMILAGGWIETLHFATNLAKLTDNQAIKNRIGEQKITIKNLINLLLPYQDGPEVADIINQLNELKDIYANITFNYEFKEPETIAEEKLTIIKSVSSVDMTSQQLMDIAAKVESIRNSIIK